VITDGDRPWEDQLFYLLTRWESYLGTPERPGINRRFMTRFRDREKPPSSPNQSITPERVRNAVGQLSDTEKKWYYDAIMAQAGTGFCRA